MERGYGGVIPQQDIPEFLSKLFHISAREGYSNSTFNTKVREARKYLARGTPNAMKYAYGKVVDAIEFRNDEMLDKAIYMATQERTRYFAERISRTELVRAYHDGFMAKWANHPDVVAFKWKLSSRHPVYDICDVYAHANLYNLGAGVFPKDEVPMLPAYPHCMCRLQPVFKENIDISKAKNQVETGGLAYIKSTSIRHQEKLLGVNGRKSVMAGLSWTQKARGYSGEKLESRMYIPETLKPFVVDGKINIEDFAKRQTNETLEMFEMRIWEYVRSPFCAKSFTNRQNLHVKTSGKYYEGKSYYSEKLSNQEVERLIFNGYLKFTNRGDWGKKIAVVHPNIQGVVISKTEEVSSHSGMIHFGNKGIHMVPRKDDI